MIPHIGIARVANAILAIVKILIRLPLLSSIYKGAIHCLKQLKNMEFQFLRYNDISKTYPKVRIFPAAFIPFAITLQMDATYWGRNFGVVIFMDASSHRVLHYRFLCGKERISDYQAGISYLQDQGFTIKAIVSYALSGINDAFPEIPYQYCQFHQLQRIRHLLTTNPRLPAAKELKALAHQLTRSSRLDFEKSLEKWEQKWKDFFAREVIW